MIENKERIMKSLFLLVFMLFCLSSMAEDRIKVAILDTGIGVFQKQKRYMCKEGHKAYSGGRIYDKHGHGTNIISIISKGIDPKTHCIVMYKVWRAEKNRKVQVIKAINSSLRNIIKDYSVRYLNISMAGVDENKVEKKLLQRLLVRGVTITVAAGNGGLNLSRECSAFPACYRNDFFLNERYHVVGSNLRSSNYGDVVTDVMPGINAGNPVQSGTSQASAQKMQKILKNVVYNSRRYKNGSQQKSSSNRRKRSYR